MSRPTGPDLVSELIQAIRYEAGLLEELRRLFRRQRAAVAGDDADGVEVSLHAVERTVLTLREARRRRVALSTLAGGGEPVGLSRLAAAFGGTLPPGLAEACGGLRSAARAAADEVTAAQRQLRQALGAGEDALLRLFAMDDDGEATGPAPGSPADRAGPGAASTEG